MLSTYLKIFASTFLWGATWISGRYLAPFMSPFSAGFLRFVAASLFLFAVIRLKDGKFPTLHRQDITGVLFLGLTGVFLYNALFFSALQHISASRASLIIAGTPAVISILSGVLFREKFHTLRIIGIFTSLIGVSLVITGGHYSDFLQEGFSYGDLCILGCVLSWAVYSIAGSKVTRRVPPVQAVAWSSLTGGLMLFPFALNADLAQVISHADITCWANLVFLGVFATGLAFTWYYEGLKAIGPTRTGIFINFVPIFACIMAFLVLREPIGLGLITGGGLVIIGVYLTNRSTRKA
ncbi:MAG: DMT family transporter [Desulfovibrio sp.]